MDLGSGGCSVFSVFSVMFSDCSSRNVLQSIRCFFEGAGWLSVPLVLRLPYVTPSHVVAALLSVFCSDLLATLDQRI